MGHRHECMACAQSGIPHAPALSTERLEKLRDDLSDRCFVVLSIRKSEEGKDVVEAISNIDHHGFVARTLLRGALLYEPTILQAAVAAAAALAGVDPEGDCGVSN